jgi:hypothetical protein
MTEVIEYITNGKSEGFRQFTNSRRTEKNKDFGFWMKDPETTNKFAFVLRPSVEAALQRFRDRKDRYLDAVTDLLVRMFSAHPANRPSISECLATVSEDIPTDSWPLLDHGEVSICGLNVNPQLRNM